MMLLRLGLLRLIRLSRGTEGTPLFEKPETADLAPDVEDRLDDRESFVADQAGGGSSDDEPEMIGAPPVDETRSAPPGLVDRNLRTQRRDDAEVGATSQS